MTPYVPRTVTVTPMTTSAVGAKIPHVCYVPEAVVREGAENEMLTRRVQSTGDVRRRSRGGMSEC